MYRRIFVFVSLSGVLGLPVVQAECEAPPEVENASHNLTGTNPPYPVNTAVRYTCNRGYTFSGYAIRVCDANNQWREHPETFRCSVKSCGDPGTPTYGSKDSHVFSVGSTVRYSCDDGYELVGNEFTTCYVSAQWSNPTPTCREIKCPALNNPANGRIVGTDRTKGTSITLECNEGYLPTGPSTAVCQQDKTWTNQPFRCQAIDCGPPPSIPNAKTVLRSGTGYANRATIRCFDNATSTSEDSAHVAFCGDEGLWTHIPLPDCLASCVTPENFEGLFKNTETGVEIKEKQTVLHGTRVNVMCKDGYVVLPDLASKKEYTCSNGNLDIAPCTEVECRIPAIENGRVVGVAVGTVVEYDARLTVECNPGLILSTPSSVTCDINVSYPTCSHGTAPPKNGDTGTSNKDLYWLFLLLLTLPTGGLVWYLYKKYRTG